MYLIKGTGKSGLSHAKQWYWISNWHNTQRSKQRYDSKTGNHKTILKVILNMGSNLDMCLINDFF